MQVTVFQGTEFREVSAEEAMKLAESTKSETWFDICLESFQDPEAASFLVDLGISMERVRYLMRSDTHLGFRIEPTRVHGVGWVDDNDGTPVVPVVFSWQNHRLLTVRTDGSQAIEVVQRRLLDRIQTLGERPTRLLGDVLELMMTTVQKGVAEMAVRIGALDMEIIQTAQPSAAQSQQLSDYRGIFQPLSSRFPIYHVNVKSALIDPPSVKGLSPAGAAALLDYAQTTADTERIISSLEDDIRAAAQDLQAQVANWQGNRINALTVVTMVFLPISFLTGYFGMNFGWLDRHLKSEFIFFILGVALMAVVAALSFFVLWRSGYSVSKGVDRVKRRERRREKRDEKAEERAAKESDEHGHPDLPIPHPKA